MSIVDKLVEGGHLSPDQVERIGESVHEFLKEADANPEFEREFFEKAGQAPFPWRTFGLLTGIGAATTATGAMVGAGIDMARDKINDLKKAKRYKAMIDANPELKGRGVNSKMVQLHFSTLNRFNPDYADDPLVSGAYVLNQLEAARPNIESLNNIVQARKHRVESRKGTDVSPAFAPATQAATSLLTTQMADPTPMGTKMKRMADVVESRGKFLKGIGEQFPDQPGSGEKATQMPAAARQAAATYNPLFEAGLSEAFGTRGTSGTPQKK